MSESFSRFIPNEFLRLLGKQSVNELRLGDFVEKEMALLFTDIRNFTALSESMTTEENFRFLNSFLKRMSPVVENYGGFIDKFIGDEIMAIFADSESAVKAALEMRIELRAYNNHRKASGYQTIETGIGVHFGRLMMGTVGYDERLQTTVVGDTVNMASRVQKLTKVFGISFLMTDAVYKRLKNPENFLLRELDSVRVRGKKTPIVLYESFDFDPLLIQQKKSGYSSQFQIALFQYKAGNFPEALTIFDECAAQCAEDPIPPIYAKRCHYLIQNPPRHWTGISVVK